MIRTRFKVAQDLASDALQRYLPRQEDEAWLAAVVDEPRFGWDWQALDKGFLKPLRDWAEFHNARLRPALAGLLIDALGDDKRRHPELLAALEFLHLASIMLDDLRNGRDLGSSVCATVTVPLPVWVTVAYNARQLAPVLIMRRAENLSGEARMRLVEHLLFQQGLGSALDLWGGERQLKHDSLGGFIAHLSVYVGAPGLGLACAAAAIAAGLDGMGTEALRRAGSDLGVALRLRALADGQTRGVKLAGRIVAEPQIRWQAALPPQALAVAADSLLASALAAAGAVAPAAGEVFSDIFFQVLSAPVAREVL